MNRWWTIVFGPELYWALATLSMYLLGARNRPPTEAGSRFLEPFIWWIPLVAVPAVFLCYLIPGPRWWLLLRINVASMVGLMACVWLVCGAIDYRDTRNSGLGAALIVSLSLGVVLLLGMDLITALVLWWKGRQGLMASA